MADGFAAPDGFDWSTIKTENVTVEVKDEEGGLYSYLVEILSLIHISGRGDKDIETYLSFNEEKQDN